jgi:hypothetical protein
MPIPEKELKKLKIKDLIVNPDNFRFINPVENELAAMKELVDENAKQMYVLAKDISENGFISQDRIAWFDPDLKKYLVIEGNRRITCLKLMTVFKDNLQVQKEIPGAKRIFKLEVNDDVLNSLFFEVYANQEEALAVLPKLHQDLNGGLGRKPWDPQAKQRSDAYLGNVSKAISIIEFLRTYPNTDPEFIEKLNQKGWLSKFERVVNFKIFNQVYKLKFDKNKKLITNGNEDKIYLMMKHLITNVIEKEATGNFRLSDEFEKFLQNIDPMYKPDPNDKTPEPDGAQPDGSQPNGHQSDASQPDGPQPDASQPDASQPDASQPDASQAAASQAAASQPDASQADEDSHEPDGTPLEPRKINANQVKKKYSVLRLCKDYTSSDYDCLGEKGKEILIELESLELEKYPYASASLCRSLLDISLYMWSNELNFSYNPNALISSFSACINQLKAEGIIENKKHQTLSNIAKNKFIDSLNSWIHGDDLLVVSTSTLHDNWKTTRIITELLIEYLNKK